jgi:cytochrome c biogenesis protein CcmG/thiol:disulfide interchange protein DsbE
MKKILSSKSNLLVVAIVLFALFKQFPILKNNLSKENETIPSRPVMVLNKEGSRSIEFPPKESKSIAIFWASWCGPCKIEMNRLKKSVESGAIPQESLFAINPFESNVESKKFLIENNYPFTFIEASTLPQELNVSVTPTTIFFDKGKIDQMSSGLSIWGIWKAELYL